MPLPSWCSERPAVRSATIHFLNSHIRYRLRARGESSDTLPEVLTRLLRVARQPPEAAFPRFVFTIHPAGSEKLPAYC